MSTMGKKRVRSKTVTGGASTTGSTGTTGGSGSTTAGTAATSGGVTPNPGAQPGTRSGLSAVALLHRLQQIADGVQKHGMEPGFPSFFAVNDIQAVHDAFALAVVTASVDQGELKSLVLASKPQLATARDLYQRGVLAVESYLGPANPKLVKFGLTPRKGAASPHAKTARMLHKRARARAVQAAAASTAPAGPSSPMGAAATVTSGTVPGPKGGV
jgi:hypothetical protein